MTNPEMRIAIAEACGWAQIEDRSSPLMMAKGFLVVGYPPVNPIIGKKETLPDYLNDLNAMNEAEDWLEKNWPQRVTDYCVEIGAVILRRANLWPGGLCGDFRKISCKADIKAEAFVRAIGKWQD